MIPRKAWCHLIFQGNCGFTKSFCSKKHLPAPPITYMIPYVTCCTDAWINMDQQITHPIPQPIRDGCDLLLRLLTHELSHNRCEKRCTRRMPNDHSRGRLPKFEDTQTLPNCHDRWCRINMMLGEHLQDLHHPQAQKGSS